MHPYFVIRESNKVEKYYFTLEAEDGEPVLTSKPYKLKSEVDFGMDSVREYSPSDAHYRREISADGHAHFVLVDINGELIGTSAEYASVEAMEEGIQIVKRIGPIARFIDISKTYAIYP